MKKSIQILYSGLGGHGGIAFDLATSFKNNEMTQELLFYGVEDINADYIKYLDQLQIKYYFIKKIQGKHLNSWWHVYMYLKKTKPHVILLHSITLIVPCLIYSISNKAKLISVEHNSNSIKRQSEWLWSLLALIFSYKVVYLTENYKEEVKHKLNMFFIERKTAVIPNGIDLCKFTPIVKKKFSEKINLFMHSRFTKVRDHHTLILAIHDLIKIHSQIHLTLAGDGETKNEMSQLVKDLGLSDAVTFTGTLNELDIINQLQNTTIYTYASLAETMSTSLMQAMACGLPIITTNIPGINNIITHGENGLLTEKENWEDLSSQINYLILNNTIAQKIGTNARLYAEAHLSKKRMTDGYKLLLSTKL